MEDVPSEAKIDVSDLFDGVDVKNFAQDEDIAQKTVNSILYYEGQFTSSRDDWAGDDGGIWNLADSAFRCSINNNSVEQEKSKGMNKGANQPNRARQASTLFHRHVTQKASNGYAVQTSKDEPFQYNTLYNQSVTGSGTDGEDKSRQMNLLAKWTMHRDRFAFKSIEFWNQLMKYGNVPVMVDWKRSVENRVKRVPKFADGVPTGEYTYETNEVVTDNYPTLEILPIESVLTDVNIGNIQDQECVITNKLIGVGDIVDGIQSGIYHEDTIEELSTIHKWDGSSGFENREEKYENRDLDEADASNTGKYLRREVFINLPIGEGDDGKWDEKKNVPVRYRVTLIGNSLPNVIVARIERNQEPDDTIPIEMIHANPDDKDILYHISMYEVLRSNISTATTLVRGALDNMAKVNDAPILEVDGEVRGNNREFGAGARLIVDNKDSISYMSVPINTGATIGLLEYINEDSNTANSFDKNMLGESFGARTSATEAQTIAGNTSRPNLVNIQYILDQYLRFVAERYYVLWPYYGLPDQYIQITDEQDRMNKVSPTDISGEFDVVVDVVDDVRDSALKVQRVNAMLQTAGQVPEFMQHLDMKEIAEDYTSALFGSTKYVKQINADAEQIARNNVISMTQNSETPEIVDGMDLQTHLRIYKAAMLEFAGTDSDTTILEETIQTVEDILGGGGAQPQGAQPELTAGQETGGELAAGAGAQQALIQAG